MASRLCIKRLAKEILMYEKENFKFPNLILRYKPDNMLIWYFLVYDLKETPFENGVYMGKVMLNEQYPLKPPNFHFITPNGRFETNKNICTTFSSYHQETYTSTWNIMTMMQGMISFMTDNPENGLVSVGSLRNSDEERCVFARDSLKWNKNDKLFNEIFPDIDILLQD